MNVGMVGAVGDDSWGKDLISALTMDGVGTCGIEIKDGQTSGIANIIVDEQTGENRILMSPGANFSLRPADFRSLPFDLPDLLVLQLEIPLDTTLQILKSASEEGVEVLFNPAPAQVLPKEAWTAVEHLIVNESEAGIITESGAEEVDWTQWGEHVERIIDLDVQHITITLGGRGVVYLDTDLRRFWRFPAEQVTVVDTTAAGDTFVGAYAVAVTCKNVDVSQAVMWANAAAARTVERSGSQSAIPWLHEVNPLGSHRQVGKSFEQWARGAARS
ncbi:putative ribokinase [Lecanora helva]